MKLGTRALPSHASSVQTAASTECFWKQVLLPYRSCFRSKESYLVSPGNKRNPKATPFELLALLLLALPLLLTLQKLVVLLALGERSHQLFADRATMQDLTQLFRKIFISGAI